MFKISVIMQLLQYIKLNMLNVQKCTDCILLIQFVCLFVIYQFSVCLSVPVCPSVCPVSLFLSIHHSPPSPCVFSNISSGIAFAQLKVTHNTHVIVTYGVPLFISVPALTASIGRQSNHFLERGSVHIKWFQCYEQQGN